MAAGRNLCLAGNLCCEKSNCRQLHPLNHYEVLSTANQHLQQVRKAIFHQHPSLSHTFTFKNLAGLFFFSIFVNRGIEFLLTHKLPLRHPPYHDQVRKLFCNSLYIWNWYGLGFLKHQFLLVLPLSERLGWSVKVFSKSLVNCAAQDMAG